jgi:hypothetical protein
MKYRPFLSHRRTRAPAVAELKRQLCIRGAGGWQDTDDLDLGGDTITGIIRAIEQETGGFIWWATKDTLASETICQTELPTALARAKRDPTYPVVPVFVELRSHDRPAIEAAIGRDQAMRLLGYNGVTRDAKQDLRDLARAAARRYVKQLVNGVEPGTVDAAVSTFRAPTGEHDLSLDWRPLFDAEARIPARGGIETITEALSDIREALQARDRCPPVCVEVSLPMPLAMLVGYQWRWTTQLRVTVETVNPSTGRMLSVEPSGASSRLLPMSRAVTLDGEGPFVLALSVGFSLGATVDRYAADNNACGFEHLHVECDFATEPLDATDIRTLAAHVVRRLNELQAAGMPKHLLLRAPANLATAIGLAGNGIGHTWVPFYDGHDGYVGGLWIG